MKKIEDLKIEDLRDIVSTVLDSIVDNEKDMAEFATDVGYALMKYDLID